MTIEYIRDKIASADHDAFVGAYAKAAQQLDAASGCLSYELARCEEEPERFTLRIEWTSTEARLQGLRKGPHFPQFLAAIRPYVGNIEEMQHSTKTTVAFRAAT